MTIPDPRARLRTVVDRLCPIAAPATVLPAYYLEDVNGGADAADYCLPCATAALAHIAHGAVAPIPPALLALLDVVEGLLSSTTAR